MNTKSVNVNTNAVNADGLILAIDLGKYKSVACAYERATAAWRLATQRTR